MSNLEDIYLGFHLSGVFLGQVMAMFTALISLTYLWQRFLLKEKKITQLNKHIPPLDTLEKALVYSLWGGFILLCLTLLSGMAYICNNNLLVDHDMIIKVVWTITIWLLYLASIIMHRVFLLPCRKLAKISLLGFSLLTLIFCKLLFFP